MSGFGPVGGPLDSGDLVGYRPRRSWLGRRRIPPGEALRSLLIAGISTVVVFVALGWIVVNAPGWADVQTSFFDDTVFRESLPKVVEAFGTNVAIFVIAEILILIAGLLIAILRGLPGPVFFPLRLLATIYA